MKQKMIGLRLVTQIRNSDHGLASGSGITKIQRKEESELDQVNSANLFFEL